MGLCSSKKADVATAPSKQQNKESEYVPITPAKNDTDTKVTSTTKVSASSASTSVSSSTTNTVPGASPGVAAALLAAPSYEYQPKEGEVPFSLSVQYFPEDVDETQEITLNGVYAKMSILQLKLLIYSHGAIKDLVQKYSNFHPVTSVRLIHETQPMADDNLLSDYGIESSGSSISFIATS